MAGTANAAVLPEPVWDWPTTSLPCHQERDGLGLDGGGLLEAELVDGFEQFGRQAQFGK